MFGFPVQARVHTLFKKTMPNAQTFTPYGATECLPVSSISGHEIVTSTYKKTKKGAGTCIGKALCKTKIKIISEKENTLIEKKP